MLLNDIERSIKDSNKFRIQITEGKISPSILILMVLHFKKTIEITDRKVLMCALYVFRSLDPKFWTRHTPYLYYTALHVAVFNSLLRFEIAMFDFPLQFFTCASIRTSEFLRHTTISLIKLLKDIFLHSSIYFMFLAKLSAFF